MTEKVMLKLENVCKTFNPGSVNEKSALKNIDLEVYEGDDIATPVTNITESDGIISFDFMGGDPTSITPQEVVSVKALPQGIAIHAETAEQARIYTANGILCRTANLTPGEHTIRLPQGFYIVQMGNASCKVVVR